MIRKIITKALRYLAFLLLSSFIIFLIFEILPGDSAEVMLGMNAEADTLRTVRENLGLDAQWYVRYLNWISGAFTGDIGNSYSYEVPIFGLITERLAVSIPLAVLSLLLTIIIAIPAGVFAANIKSPPAKFFSSLLLQVGMSIPNFWLGILLIMLFSVHLGYLPSGGFSGWENGFFVSISQFILPALALSLPQISILTGVTRSSVREILREDFPRALRSRGMSDARVLWLHAVPNALIPVMTIIGLQFSFLVTGVVIIENVFYLPGLGRLILQSIHQRDIIVIKNVVMLLIIFVSLVNLVIDILLMNIDPRMKSKSTNV